MENQELSKLFKKQVAFATADLSLWISALMGFVLLISLQDEDGGFIFGSILLYGSGIASFVIWILGIINAAKINSITKDSEILIVFSVLTLIFVHLIVATQQRKKFKNFSIYKQLNANRFVQPSEKELKLQKLRADYIDGLIDKDTYDKKLKELEKENQG